MVRSASPWAPVRYWARASSSHRRSRNGAARTISWARGRASRAWPPRSCASSRSSSASRRSSSRRPASRRAGGHSARSVKAAPAPQVERLLQQERGAVRLTQRAAARGPVATSASNRWASTSSARARQPVAVAGGLDGVGAERLAQPDDARLEVLVRRGRRDVAPERVRQLVGRDGASLTDGQGLEYDTVAGTETSRAVHGQRAEDLDAHALHGAPRRRRTSTLRIPDGYRRRARRIPARRTVSVVGQPGPAPPSISRRTRP